MTGESKRPLKVGYLVPETEGQMNGETARWGDLRALAETAEAVGFDSVWVTDHFIHREGADERGPWECWSLVSAIAAITARVEIGTLVLGAGFRNPALLAKMADTVEEISGGRLILGLGAGWNEPEYRAFGYPFDNRVARFEEALQIIVPLLRTGKVDFEGRYYQARKCELRPRGPRPEGPPILIGTAGKRMMELTARYADEWNVWFSPIDNNVDKLRELMTEVGAVCAAVGREPVTLARSAAVKIEVGPHAPSAMSVAPLIGTPEQLADQLLAYAAIGVTQVQVWPEPNTVAGLEKFGRVLEALDRN
jgi:probable F420-dependent oxidoreductase